jgi:hypothetical protein
MVLISYSRRVTDRRSLAAPSLSSNKNGRIISKGASLYFYKKSTVLVHNVKSESFRQNNNASEASRNILLLGMFSVVSSFIVF